MTDQAQHSDGERSAISWRAAVERSEAVARAFEDGRPVYGVDERGHVVVANNAAAVFGGGQVGFGRAVPPGGTVAALVARFAMKAAPGDSAFERTRAILGLRASMLGLKLAKVEVAPRGALTLVTFAEGVAPLPNYGGLLGDPRDADTDVSGSESAPAATTPALVVETDASDRARVFQEDLDRGPAAEPVMDDASASADDATSLFGRAMERAVSSDAMPTMEDPFSDASFAAFSPISLDADGWTTPLAGAASADEPAFEPPMAAALMPDAVSIVEGADEADGEAVSHATELARTSEDLVTTEALEADEREARGGGEGSEPDRPASDDQAAAFNAMVGDIAPAWPSDELPLPSDAIALGVIDRATVADSAVDRVREEAEEEATELPSAEANEGIAALLALDGVEDAEAVDAARAAEEADLMDTEVELSAFDPSSAPTETEDASVSAEAPMEPDLPVILGDEAAPAAPPAYEGRMEPHRFVWQMDGSRRFTLVSRELADAVGAPGEALVGRTWAEVAVPLRLDPEGRVDAALARRDTWSGLTVWWPVEGAPVRVPVDLAALPSFGRNRTFDGYRGFGVCRTSDWRADGEASTWEPEGSGVDGVTAPSERIEAEDAPVADAPLAVAPLAAALDLSAGADLDIGDDQSWAPQSANSDPVGLGLLDESAVVRVPEDMTGQVEPMDSMAPLTAPVETEEEDAVLRRMNADLHDAAHSALEDVTETPVSLDAEAPLATPVDPDVLALAEGSALPPDVALPSAEPESFVPATLATDGAGLGDAVAELSDYLDPVEVDAPVAPVADLDVIGLPTWHEPARLLAPDAIEIEGDAANRLDEAQGAIEDATAIEAAAVLDAVEPTEATVGAMGEAAVDASGDADGSSLLITNAMSPADAPVEAALILEDVEARADDGSSEARETTALDEGLPVDDRFGLVDAVPEAGPVTASTRGDRASLSEIAAALNQEMRAREAEAARAEADAKVREDDAVTPTANGPIADGLVAFVPPQRPDNVIAAPIGPSAKVVTLPAGPRIVERGSERGPLSPPERDAFRQIARVLGARMEDEPAPGVGLVAAPKGHEAPLSDATASTGEPIGDVTQTLADATTALGSDTDAAAAAAPDALVPEVADRLVGSLGEAAVFSARDTEPMVASVDAEGEDRGMVEVESEARFVEARALTDLSIGHDEAAFVADRDLDAMATDATARPFASLETSLDGAHDQDPFAAVSLDEGTESGPHVGLVDDLIGEGLDARGGAIDERADGAQIDEIAAKKATTGVSAGSSEQPVLEEFPMAVAVVQGQDIPFANQAFLDLLRYASLDDLNQAGGLDALFAGPHALKGWTGDASIRPLPAITRDGEVVPVCVRIAKTRWADAPALVMAMEPAERAAATLAAPTDGLSDASARADSAALAAPATLVSGMGDLSPDADEIDPRARVAELEAVLDTATDGVAILDQDGTVASMNRAGQALFGADAASLEGRKLVDLLAPESRRAAQDYLDGLARNGVQSLLNDGREVIALEAGGGLVPLFMTIGRLGEGRSRAFCAVMRDITQWKKAEEELTAAKKHAELASLHKSDFLAKISHEIRTPLNAIMGFAEVMIDERFGSIGTERYKEYLKDIRTSGAHIMSLVNDLLDLSKIEAGKLDLKFEAVDLNAILRECVALMQPQANRERIIIRASLPTQVPPIVADSRSIRQIMLNLLSNAVKFTPAGGQVIVSTALEDQGQVALRVRDTGVGMTETEVTQALEPFRQVHTAKSGAAGTGLGLPLTKALVEANRAAFVIRSTPGQGTLVEIVFPSTRVLAS